MTLLTLLLGGTVPSTIEAPTPAAGASATPQQLPAGVDADYQLGGAYQPALGVGIVVRDRHDDPLAGAYSVCYLNAFQTQPGSLRWWRRHHAKLLLRDGGTLVRDRGWPDEVLLDTSTASTRRALAHVLAGWTNRCAEDGFAAVEPDNLDSFTRSRGHLTRADNMGLAQLVATTAHEQGLAIAQKNLAQLPPQVARRVGFDFAVAEDCQRWRECGSYRRTYGDAVLEVEYADNGRRRFSAACRARGDDLAIVYRDRVLRPAGRRAGAGTSSTPADLADTGRHTGPPAREWPHVVAHLRHGRHTGPPAAVARR